MGDDNSISFYVNDKSYTINNVQPTQVLNTWLRAQPGLTGTKSMCYEGGCGACVVALQRPSENVIAVNSCLLLLCTLDGCHITTVEGIGSNRMGYDKIQIEMASFGASQCGYCTPGFVMSMKSLLEESPTPSQQLIEDNFDGNICRCTGYRSILDAMKTFASDAGQTLRKKCVDIEDLGQVCCKKLRSKFPLQPRSFKLTSGSSTWVRPTSFAELKFVLQQASSDYKLVCGNSSTGVYRDSKSYSMYVDIGQVSEFQSITDHSNSVEFGASVTLSRLVDYLMQKSNQSVTFEPIVSHVKHVASKPIRNFASWAGNVMLKHQHNEFPSDVCTLLQAGSAVIKVYDVTSDSYSTHTVYGSNGIMNVNMDKKVVVAMVLPKIADDGVAKMKTFKVAKRSQNAHAYVNCAFLAEVTGDHSSFTKLALVFGAISATFYLATATENYLVGKEVNSNETLKGEPNESECQRVWACNKKLRLWKGGFGALATLSDEVKAATGDLYQTNLALGFFYKFYLSLCDASQLGPGIASGIDKLARPISLGTQIYKTNPSTYPVSKNIPKIAGILQASGEAKYISDQLPETGDLFCNVVLAEVGNADIDTIDVTEAEKISGCVAIITKDNFPPIIKNCYLYPRDSTLPIVATDHVSFAGQIVAIVVAESFEATFGIVAAVKVTYKNQQKVLITNQDAIDAKSFDGTIPDFVLGEPVAAIAAAKHVVSGQLEFDRQYHFYMETNSCRVQCTEENGFKIEASTQSQTYLQQSLSYTFDVPAHKIEISTKRLGGSYGGKATNSQLPTCIAALAAHVTNRPVHFHATLETSMKMLGTRSPYTLQYKVGFDDDGIIAGIDANLYTNSGCNSVDGEANDQATIKNFADSAYFCPNRRYKRYLLLTNLPPSTICRAPGSLQMTATADFILEHVASYLKKNPVDIKMANLYKIGETNLVGETMMYIDFRSIYQKLLTKYCINERMQAIETFNQSNRWKKKGIAVTPMKYRIDAAGSKYVVLVTIYASDGSVLVSHAGIESGQGINTKVAQVVAYKLGIPLDMVMVQRTSNITSANSDETGGSLTSENVCHSAMICCDILNARIEPVRSSMSPTVTWPKLIEQCYKEFVNLSVSDMAPPANINPYESFGVTAAEVEYDVITGERQITQVDTVFDCGISLNPAVDIGQIEGAFMMGVGFWLSEKMNYDKTTGLLLTDGTWEYKPPASQDIPIKWNIELLEDHPNPVGVLRSKASGEPPLCMSVSVALALKRAVEATRKDRGILDYFELPTPATVDAMHNASNLDPVNDFVLK